MGMGQFLGWAAVGFIAGYAFDYFFGTHVIEEATDSIEEIIK